MTWDIALVETPKGVVVLHRADCPLARAAAERGWPVATLFGCERLPTGLPTCVCMRGAYERKVASLLP